MEASTTTYQQPRSGLNVGRNKIKPKITDIQKNIDKFVLALKLINFEQKNYMSYNQLLYQIVFATKNHKKVLLSENKKELYKYIWGILKKKKCHLYRINGVADHIHIVTHIPPSIAISNLVKDVKVASSIWIKGNSIFPNFEGWQRKYGVFSYHISEKDRLIEYVKNQEEHHKKITFKEEFINLLKETGVEYNEKYLFGE